MARTAILRYLLVAALAAALPTTSWAAEDDLKPDTVRKELNEIKRTNHAGRMAILVKRLAKVDDPKLVPLLVEAAVAMPSAQSYQIALKAIAGFKNEETIEALLALFSTSSTNKDYKQRVLVLEAFGLRKDSKSREIIYQCFKDSGNANLNAIQVQVAAVLAMRSRKEKEAVPVLIELLKKHNKLRDRLLVEVREALLELTGEDFDAVEDWEKFWESHKDSLDPKKLGQSKGPTQRAKIKKTEDSVEFFGKEVLSRNVCFVIDCSGSMVLYDEPPPDDTKEYKSVEVERQRLKRAKDEMMGVIAKLKGKSRFNIIAYNSQIFPWKKFLVPASPENYGAAKNFIKNFKAYMLTYTDDAMDKAFEDPGIDTIVLLSDGAPYRGPGPDPMELQKKILSRVKDHNSSRKVRIDTYGFEGEGKVPRMMGGGSAGGSGPDSTMVQFLKDLAAQNSGEYHAIK